MHAMREIGTSLLRVRESPLHLGVVTPEIALAAPPKEKLRRAAGSDGVGAGSDSELQPPNRRRRRRGRRGAGRRGRQNRAGSRPSSSAESSSPSPPPSPPRREDLPGSDLCFIDRILDMEQWEVELEYLWVVVQIVGTRRPVQPQEARRTIQRPFYWRNRGWKPIGLRRRMTSSSSFPVMEHSSRCYKESVWSRHWRSSYALSHGHG